MYSVKLRLIIFSLLLFCCQLVTAQLKPGTKVVTKIKNGIKLNNKGFVVSSAVLYFEDGSSVPETNKVALNQKVVMLLMIEGGWSERDGMVFPGGTEEIKLNTGKVILTSDDLFKSYDETGVSVKDARYLSLKAVITEMSNKKNYVIVKFRVWDKKGTAEITGSYKLFIE